MWMLQGLDTTITLAAATRVGIYYSYATQSGGSYHVRIVVAQSLEAEQ